MSVGIVPVSMSHNGVELRCCLVHSSARAEDLVFEVQTSPDLSAGSWTTVQTTPANVSVSEDVEANVDEITVHLPYSADEMFVRLRVIEVGN